MTYPFQPLSSLGAIQTGSTPLTSEEKYWGGDVPFVTPAELDQTLPVLATPRTLSEEGVQRSRILQEGAVMVCCIGSLGKIGIAGRSLVTNQQINAIEFDQQKIWPKYGFYACQRLKPKLLSTAPATTIPIVSKSKFGQLEIQVPPLPEQRRIAAILDQADALRAKRREALAQLDSLTQSIFIEMFGDPTTNPKGLHQVRLDEVTTLVNGRAFKLEEWEEDGLPIIRIQNLNDDTKPFNYTRQKLPEKFKVMPRDILFSWSGTPGTSFGCFRWKGGEGWLNQHIFKVLLDEKKIDGDFFIHQINLKLGELIAKAHGGVGLQHVTKGMVDETLLSLPPLSDQLNFSKLTAEVEKQKILHVIATDETEKLFSSLQHRAFRGVL